MILTVKDMSEEKKQLVTSLRVDADLWKEIKVEAIKNDMTLTEAVRDAIKCWIAQQAKRKGEG